MAFCDTHPKVLDDIEGILTENRIFKQRNVDIGVVTAEEAMEWRSPGRCCAARAWRGTCARPSPTTSTRRIDFDVPVGKNGDCYDRYLVRMEEMRQSLAIMRQCGRDARGAGDDRGPQDRAHRGAAR